MSFLNHPHFTHPSRAVVIAETIALLLLLSILGLDEAFTLLNQPSNSAVFFGVVILAALGGIYVTVGVRVWRYFMTRRTLVVVLVTFTAVSLAGCGARVNPGYVGIKVNYYGSSRGVDDYPIVTGMVWYNPLTTTVFEYPTFTQTAVWTRSLHEGNPVNEEISFNSSEGLGKIKAIQDAIRVENEVRATRAEAQKAIAKAEGEAKANAILAQSLSPSLIQWRQLDLTEKAIARWNGVRPLVEGQASGLLLNVPTGGRQ